MTGMNEITKLHSQRQERMRIQSLLAANEESSELLAIRNSHLTLECSKDKMKKTSLMKLAALQKNHQGFTLVEFLVSFTLVMLLLTGTVQLTIHSLLVKRNADINLKTAELASSLLEYFKSLPYESEELEEGLKSKTFREEGSAETFREEWRVENISPNLKKIEVECYSEKHPLKKIRLVLYLSRELGF